MKLTNIRLVTLGFGMAVFAGNQASNAQPAEPEPIGDADTAPYIRSALPLDEPRHLCIDLPGYGASADPDAPFTVHTCKDGMWNYDERFRWTEDGVGLRMPQYGKCLAVAEISAGADIVLSDCGSNTAKILFENARLKPQADTSYCITIADVRSELTPGGRKFPERYRARPLSLEPCSDSELERQLWTVTQPLDLKKALLPPAGSLPVEQQ